MIAPRCGNRIRLILPHIFSFLPFDWALNRDPEAIQGRVLQNGSLFITTDANVQVSKKALHSPDKDK
jgi:hypothetical protein